VKGISRLILASLLLALGAVIQIPPLQSVLEEHRLFDSLTLIGFALMLGSIWIVRNVERRALLAYMTIAISVTFLLAIGFRIYMNMNYGPSA
jgi:hypothetical protein